MTQALHLDAVQIVRLPGIDEPFGVPSLSPGVNLVFGPNASGKSSLIRAIEAVLWPATGKRPLVTVSARFQLAGDTWDVRVDADSTRALRNGEPVSTLVLPAPELRHRYRLSLHDLLGAEMGDGGFAAAIARASVGGLDLQGAADALGFVNKAPTRLQARTEWEASRSALDQARGQAAALHRDAETLSDLERARDDAGSARADIARVEAAMRAREVQARARATEDALRALPPGVGDLTGREFSEAELLLVRWRELASLRARVSRERDTAAQTMRELFVDRVPTDAEQRVWQALAARLHEHDERGERDTLNLRAREAERDQARRLCGPLANDAQLAQLNTASLETLVAFARRFASAQGALSAAQQQQLALAAATEGESPAPHLSAESLRDLLRVLTRWLAADARSATAAASLGTWWWLLVAIGALGWMLLAVQWHWTAALGAALVLLIVVLTRRAAPRDDGELARLQREYGALGGAPLAAWTSAHVGDALDATARNLAAARTRERNETRRADADRAVANARAQMAPLDAEHAALASQWSVAPDADAQTLPWFVHQLVTWSDAHRAVLALEARGAAERVARAATHDELAVSLAQHHVPVPESAAAIDGVLASIDARVHAYHDARRAHDDAERDGRTLDAESAGLRAAWRALLERTSVGAVELPQELQVAHEQTLRHTLTELESRMQQRAQFQALSQQYRDAMRDGDTAAAPHEADPAFHALQNSSDDDLARALATASERAAAYTEHVEQAATLRHRIHAAKRAHNVEAALARLDERSSELERAHQATLEALVGNALLEHVQDQTRDMHRPAVFHRARELFARITHGRWQLMLEESDARTPGFRAIDSRTLRECPLHELSSGTRVQLLVAVRMAFVEITEGTVRLPLFLDEALGTSDDQRAQALIDAALELASDGRQLFYFTAQRDEVEKWRSALTSRAIAWKEHDLAAIRRGFDGDGAVRAPTVHVPPRPPTVPPEPAQHTHASYGTALQVPPVRPGVTPTSATHPWYVIEDVHVLHEVLLLSMTSWGELQWYTNAHGHFPDRRISKAQVADALGRAQALMRAVDVLHRESRVGRGAPVDRARLVEAGVSPERVLEAMSEIATECAGDAHALLARLATGAVPGFGPQRLRTLRERLIEIGCLDEAVPRTAGEIRLAMLAAVSAELPVLAVDALLSRIADVGS